MRTIPAGSVVKFIKGIVSRFGVPNPIITDNGSQFTSNLIPRLAQYVLKRLLVNCEPLLVMMRLGTPNRITIPLMNLTADPAGMVPTASTSAHLVNLSMPM